MSVRVMAIVWGWKLPAVEKLVALKLADCANDSGENAFPALATIADECGLSRRGVQGVLDRLEQRGLVAVQAEHTNRRPTTYRVNLDAVVRDAPDASLEVHDVHPGDAPAAPLEVHVVHPRGAPGSPLEVHGVHPIRQVPVRDPSDTHQRAREAGRREHPLDERVRLEPWSMTAFDEFWALYPRKDGEVAALRAWHALNPPRELAELIVEHVRVRVKLGWAREVPLHFLPLARTFLDERRWQEKYQPRQPTVPAPATSAVPDADETARMLAAHRKAVPT